MGWWRDVFGPATVSKAAAPSTPPAPPEQPKSHNIDPFAPGFQNQKFEQETWSAIHPGARGLGFPQLAEMARVPLIAAVFQRRINQVADMCVPQVSKHATGFSIPLRDRRAKMTRAAERRSRELERIVLAADGGYGHGNFEMSIRALVRDSLRYDQAVAEILRTRGGKVCGFVPMDAATFRLAVPNQAQRDTGRFYPRNQDVAVIQKDQNGRAVAEFKRDEVLWGIRRPRTDQGIGRYGYPELDELISIVTALVNAQTYNAANFTNGVHANHIITLMSTMDGTMFRAVRKQITAMLTGVRNAHRTPVIQLDPRYKEALDVKSLSTSNKDMEYSQWMNWLLKAVCMLLGMDPAELGILYGPEGQTSALTAKGPEERNVASKEGGLRPLLRALAWWLSTWVVQAVDEDFMLEFTGLTVLSEAEQLDLDIKALGAFKTLNDIRRERDLPPIDLEVADWPLNQTFVNAALQQSQVGDEAESGEDGDGGGGREDDVGEDLIPFPGADPLPRQEGALDQAMKGANWNDVDDWTRRFALAADEARRQGRIVTKGQRSSQRAYIIQVAA